MGTEASMQMGCCQSVINCKYSNDVEEISTRTNSIAINAFQMCKKGEIFQENIEMQLRLVSQFTPSEEDSYEEGDESDEEDYGNFMARCQSLSYNVEIGELHERDKFNWIINKTSQRGGTGGLEDKKVKQLDFNFKLNHIKQVIKVEVYGIFRPRKNQKLPEGQQFYDKKLFVGFFNFARCVLKNGQYSLPHQVSFTKSQGISVKLAIEEKAKKGGYRCITLKVQDYKGGDFVESTDYSMVVVDSQTQSVLAEISSKIPLLSSPEGLFKRIEIGINNYQPATFMRQSFTIYFFKDKDKTP